jgi:uncharacterized protein HemY
MRRFFLILAGIAVVCAVTYLGWLNPGRVEIHLTPTRVVQPPLAAALVFAFLIGVTSILTGIVVQSTSRSLRAWWSGRSTRRDARADDFEQRGQAMIWAGDDPGGRALLLRAWRRSPSHRRAVLLAAESHLHHGDAAAAESLLREAAERNGNDPETLLLLSEAYAQCGDTAGAIHALERIRAQHPRAARVLARLRDRYVAAGRWPEAAQVQGDYLRTLNRSESIARERERLRGLRYEAALTRQAVAERISALEELLDAHPGFVPAVVSLGDAVAQAVGAPDAVEIWQRALRITPRTVLVERLLQHAEPAGWAAIRQQLRKLRPSQTRGECVSFWQIRAHTVDTPPVDSLARLDQLPANVRATIPCQRFRGELLAQLGQLEQALAEYGAALGNAVPVYCCRTCREGAPAWRGRCPRCGDWDSDRSCIEIAIA